MRKGTGDVQTEKCEKRHYLGQFKDGSRNKELHYTKVIPFA